MIFDVIPAWMPIQTRNPETIMEWLIAHAIDNEFDIYIRYKRSDLEDLEHSTYNTHWENIGCMSNYDLALSLACYYNV